MRERDGGASRGVRTSGSRQHVAPAFSRTPETCVVTGVAALQRRGMRRVPATSRRHVKACPKEFREQVAKPASSSGRRPREIAREFEISADSVRRRVKQAQRAKCPRRRRHFSQRPRDLRLRAPSTTGCRRPPRARLRPGRLRMLRLGLQPSSSPRLNCNGLS